jgi:hypothetical protein
LATRSTVACTNSTRINWLLPTLLVLMEAGLTLLVGFRGSFLILTILHLIGHRVAEPLGIGQTLIYQVQAGLQHRTGLREQRFCFGSCMRLQLLHEAILRL